MSHKTIIIILTTIAVILIVGGFFCPPLAVIDGSVLTAVGEIFAFSALWVAFHAISRGADVTIKHGEMEVNVDNPDEVKK